MLNAVRGKLADIRVDDPVLSKVLHCFALSLRDMVKVCTHILTSVVQLRRDAALLHTRSMSRSMRNLRHADIINCKELFPPQLLDSVDREHRERQRDLALSNAARQEQKRCDRYDQPRKRTHSSGSTPRQSRPNTPASQQSNKRQKLNDTAKAAKPNR